MTYKESTRGSGIGTFVGFLCGVGVGLLFATKPGNETRRQIADMINKGREKGRGLIRQRREQVENVSGQPGVPTGAGKEPFYESGKYT